MQLHGWMVFWWIESTFEKISGVGYTLGGRGYLLLGSFALSRPLTSRSWCAPRPRCQLLNPFASEILGEFPVSLGEWLLFAILTWIIGYRQNAPAIPRLGVNSVEFLEFLIRNNFSLSRLCSLDENTSRKYLCLFLFSFFQTCSQFPLNSKRVNGRLWNSVQIQSKRSELSNSQLTKHISNNQHGRRSI